MKVLTIPKITINGDIAFVYLGDAYFAVIDAIDVTKIDKYNWYYKIDKKNGKKYAYTYFKRKDLAMHSLILPTDSSTLVDHIDRNGLNNRRSNLREATHKQNMENQNLKRKNFSGFRGVRRSQQHTTAGNLSYAWVARVTHNKQTYSETFPYTDAGFEEAKSAAKQMRKELFTHSED